MVEKTRHRKIPEIVSWSETVACKGANLCISYDAQNRRVYRKADEDQSGSQETELYYVLDGNQVIEERVYSDEDLKRDYWYGVYIDNPVYARCDLNDDNDFSDTDEQFYYLHNTQYSVHAIIDTSGSIIEVYKNYQPYGAVDVYTGDGGDSDWWDGDETTGSLSSNYYLFTGRRYDPEADLMFYRNRMYSTGRGRFLQRDPIGYVDGLNLYRAYFVPMGMDPLGLLGPIPPSFIEQNPEIFNEPGEQEWNPPGASQDPEHVTARRRCHDWIQDELQDMDWIDDLPHCPCILTRKCNVWQTPEGDWTSPDDASQTYHPGADQCIRSTSNEGGPGQQCCYYSDGKLITSGLGAGTPDRISPEVFGLYGIHNFFGHLFSDVTMFVYCRHHLGESWVANEYHRVRPPDQGDCP